MASKGSKGSTKKPSGPTTESKTTGPSASPQIWLAYPEVAPPSVGNPTPV